jgi:hypothetical protein
MYSFPIQGSDNDHAMTCNCLIGSHCRWHNHWKELSAASLLTRAAMCAMSPVTLPLVLQRLAVGGVRPQIEVTLPPPHGPTLLDTSITHPLSPTYAAAVSRTRGSVATLRDGSKYRAHVGHMHPGRMFWPMSDERYRHLGKPIMQHIRTLSKVTSAHILAVTGGSILASAHPERGTCTESRLRAPLSRASAHQGCRAACVARNGHGLLCLGVLLWLK